jgi:small subunit ribosomal protein S6e
MKLNIAYPSTGCQKVIEVEDEKKLRAFYDKRISAEVEGEALGPDFAGYVFRISGGNDKEGFCMKQGVLTQTRVRLLLADGHSCYRPRKRGERKRKSVRGCVVSSELSVLNLVIVKKGDNEIPGLTDTIKPRRLGPKRATRIRKLFNLDKKDDVRAYVIKRQITKDGKKPYFKSPKIQRLVTPDRLQRKRHMAQIRKKRYEKSKAEAETYNKLLAARFKEAKDKRAAVLSKRRSLSRKASGKEEPKAAAAAAGAAPKAAAAAPKKAPASKKEASKKADGAKKEASKKAAPKQAAPKAAAKPKTESKKAEAPKKQ